MNISNPSVRVTRPMRVSAPAGFKNTTGTIKITAPKGARVFGS